MENIDYSSRRRAQRAQVMNEESPPALVSAGLKLDSLPLLDISELGTRVKLVTDPSRLKMGAQATASLILGEGFQCALRARIVHLGADSAGVEFIDAPRSLQQLIRAYFRHELLGASLRPFRSAGRQDLLRFSDHGPNSVELSFDGPELDRFSAELNTFGAHLSWTRDLPHLSLHRTRPLSADPFNEELQPREILRLLRNIPALNPKAREKVELILAA